MAHLHNWITVGTICFGLLVVINLSLALKKDECEGNKTIFIKSVTLFLIHCPNF